MAFNLIKYFKTFILYCSASDTAAAPQGSTELSLTSYGGNIIILTCPNKYRFYAL